MQGLKPRKTHGWFLS